ncbi:hypothetical protein QTP70_031583 [Hemibagrus guttatus]|uniref:Uncharacterized protein n=1 Tax=Hemibagrus guttatus TaxID=175788 RepID=A0AAE0RE51_9TELE|nr:hypothetical protein QTP70_031583 [Hemibagrus guttatus]
MYAGLLSLCMTGALLLQCLGDTNDNYETVTPTEEYSTYAEYIFEYETHETGTIDYDVYVSPNQISNNEQFNTAREQPVHGGMNEINNKASTLCRYYAVGLGLLVQQFCQQK